MRALAVVFSSKRKLDSLETRLSEEHRPFSLRLPEPQTNLVVMQVLAQLLNRLALPNPFQAVDLLGMNSGAGAKTLHRGTIETRLPDVG